MGNKPTHDSIPADWETALNADAKLPWIEPAPCGERLTPNGAELVMEIAELMRFDTSNRYKLLVQWNEFFERFRAENRKEGQCEDEFCPQCMAAILMAYALGGLMKSLGTMEAN